MPKDTYEPGPFDYFLNSERIDNVKTSLMDKPTLDTIMDAREGDQDALLFLVAQSFKAIKSGYALNKSFGGREHEFLNILLKSLIYNTKKESGPFWSVDILESGSDSDQIEQLAIEFYSYAKKLTTDESQDYDIFSDEQEVHPILEDEGLFVYLSGIKPEYSQILSYMAHYTPSDELCQEMGIPGIQTLKSKINALRTLVDAYYKREDKRDSDYYLAGSHSTGIA